MLSVVKKAFSDQKGRRFTLALNRECEGRYRHTRLLPGDDGGLASFDICGRSFGRCLTVSPTAKEDLLVFVDFRPDSFIKQGSLLDDCRPRMP